MSTALERPGPACAQAWRARPYRETLQLRDFTTQVPQRHVALVAVAETDDGLPVLLAEARHVVDVDSRCAEFALAVADDWQGLGLGRAQLQRLALQQRGPELWARFSW